MHAGGRPQLGWVPGAAASPGGKLLSPPGSRALTCSVMRCTAGDLLHTKTCSWLAGLMWQLLMATSTPVDVCGGLRGGEREAQAC